MKVVQFNSFTAHARIFWALLRRDLLMLKQNFRGILLDSAAVFFVQTIVFGKLFPAAGMPQEFVAPLYLGSIVSFLIFSSYAFGLRITFDLQSSRFIDYQLTLPLPKHWLIAEYITFFVIETLIITLPLVTIGILFLGTYFTLYFFPTLFFIAMYIFSLFFLGLFFIGLCFWYDFDYYSLNIWPRRLSPMFTFSSNFLIWKQVYAFAPKISYLILLNPFTYISEGLRSTLLGTNLFIPTWICVTFLLVASIFSIILARFGLQKRLDPV